MTGTLDNHARNVALLGATTTVLVPTTSPRPDAAMFAGLGGELVGLLEGRTEADPVAILGHFLAFFGSSCGSGPHFVVEDTVHQTNSFLLFVGRSAVGRKGTARDRAMAAFREADEGWCRRITSGLSSGEGVIAQVADPAPGAEPVDRRLMVVESEFGAALRVMRREGNTLSAVLRNAWDGTPLRILTKSSPLAATHHHISVLGHIVQEELRATLPAVEAANGFGNRFLYLAVQRSRLLPDGGTPLEPKHARRFTTDVQYALDAARNAGRMERDPAAAQLWREVYPRLTADRSGLVGRLTSRAEAHVVRLSMLYALTSGRGIITRADLEAALALWRYSEAGVGFLFGGITTDPDEAAVLDALATAPVGLSLTDLRRAAFAGHIHAGRLRGLVDQLAADGRVVVSVERTAGRSRQVIALPALSPNALEGMPTDGTSE